MNLNRIDSIIKQVKTSGVVVDVGSDHAKLAINLLEARKATHIYNIEINQKPLNVTIKNLKENGLIKKTTNILANGLQTDLIKDKISYCVIAGMGGKNIINILRNKNQSIKIDKYIFVPNNNAYELRKFLKSELMHISFEQIIEENNYYYPLIVVSKKGLKIKNDFDCYFGPYNMLHPSKAFALMNKKRMDYIVKNRLDKFNKAIKHEREILNKLWK